LQSGEDVGWHAHVGYAQLIYSSCNYKMGMPDTWLEKRMREWSTHSAAYLN